MIARAPAPAISVVLCTLNRAAYLRTALQSLAEQAAPHPSFEVIVVDNGSTDETPQVAAEFARLLPLRHVVEPELGLCNARNTGWRESRARIVAYLDDDAVALPEWLSGVCDAFSRGPDVGVAGGPIHPIWLAPRPGWLTDLTARALTIVDWPGGPRCIDVVRAEWLAGANMAVPRAVLEAVGGFDPRLDRIGHNMLSNGDIHVQQMIVARGLTAVYEPRMAISHAVPPDRLTQRWFRRRYYWQGISDSVMYHVERSPSTAQCLRDAVGHAAHLLRSPRRLRALARRADDARTFEEQCMALVQLGHIAGLIRVALR